MQFYGTRLSENMAKTPEGYLICYDVPIARIGTQEYLGSELGVKDDVVTVDRPAEEVFKPATLASFEGKPFTNDHPFELLDASNTLIYEKGHIQNVRVSDDKIYIIADIIIKDEQTIRDIEENGKREISAGYNCDCLQAEDGHWYQANIIGNHVALVDKGRAGEKVRINDNETKKEIKVMDKKGMIGKLIKAFSKDAEPEEIAQAIEAVNGNDEEQGGEDRLGKLEAMVQDLCKRMDAYDEATKPAETVETTALDECEKELQDADKEGEDGEEEKEVKDEDANNDPKLIEAIAEKAQNDEDTTEEIKKEIADAKKVIAKIEDKETRLAVADSLATIIRGKMKSSANYKKLMDASKKQPEVKETKVDYDAVFKKIKEERFRK